MPAAAWFLLVPLLARFVSAYLLGDEAVDCWRQDAATVNNTNGRELLASCPFGLKVNLAVPKLMVESDSYPIW